MAAKLFQDIARSIENALGKQNDTIRQSIEFTLHIIDRKRMGLPIPFCSYYDCCAGLMTVRIQTFVIEQKHAYNNIDVFVQPRNPLQKCRQ